MRWFFIVAALAALCGAVLAALAWVAPESGVGGTAGVVICLVGALVAAQLSLVLFRGAWRPWAATLALLVSLLSAVAAWFLMLPAVLASLLVALAAVIAGLASGPGAHRRRPA